MQHRLAAFLGRQLDRTPQRPPGMLYSPEESPPFALAIGLALQHIAVQSVYFVLPAAMAGLLSTDPADITRFLCLSILATSAWQILQILVRGPVGSGYPIPGTHTASMIGAYALTAQAGGGFAAASAMVLISGAACVVLTFLMRRLRVLLPNEVAGVVVLLIGVALIGLATQRLGMIPGHAAPDAEDVAIAGASLALMLAITLSRSRFAPFAVLLGASGGVPLALWLGRGVPHAAELLASRPWTALPAPFWPDFAAVSPAAMAAFLVALVAINATALGTMVAVQRATDAGWTRADAPPLRRGLLANGLAIIAAGLLGGATPGPATAAVGLSIATGVLSRRIIWIGAGLLIVLALCPRLVALFVLVPEPVKAAMLFYVAGFIMAQGCQLITARLLDTRRTVIVALGLTAGITAAVAPDAFRLALPAVASPLSLGALVAFIANLATLPLVTRRATLELTLDDHTHRAVTDWTGDLGGAWGLKAQTAIAAEHAMLELAELLHGRAAGRIACAAQRQEDRIVITLAWTGPELPAPSLQPHYDDLLGTTEEQERFAVWLATRQAQNFSQKRLGETTEARLVFED